MGSTTGWGTEIPHALTTTPPQKSKYLLENTDNIYVQMKNLGHQDRNLKKKKQIEKWEMTSMAWEIKMSFNGLISRLDMIKEIISKTEETLPIFLMPKPIPFPLQMTMLFHWNSSRPAALLYVLHQFSSVAQLCLTLCDPMDCRMPGLLVHHQLLEFTQTHVHWVGDAIQLFHPLSSPSPPAFYLSQHQGLFKWVSSSHQVAKILELQLQHQSFQWIFRTDFL